MANTELKPAQLHALLNILSHHEIYAEIEAFKFTKAIREYGPPFQSENSGSSTSPSLQSLVTKVLLPLPGLKNVAASFWPARVQPMISALSAANLSESYDKGICGQRRTVSTATSTLLEYPNRGIFGGCPLPESAERDRQYDESSPTDTAAAWHDFVRGGVYGDVIDNVVAKAAETDQLSEHPPLTRAAHKFIVLNLASLMHYTLVISPKGPALLSLLEAAHKLVPYAIIRQTLRIGNAATMISAMVRVVLAKASVGAVTNWLGVSQGADEGMNLMQTIISTVLGWDIKKLKARLAKIEKAKEAPSKDQMKKLQEFTNKNQGEQESVRSRSAFRAPTFNVQIANRVAFWQDLGLRLFICSFLPAIDTRGFKDKFRDLANLRVRRIVSNLISIVTAILDEPLVPATHALALEYLSLVLSIRDREQLISIFCRQNPDLLTPIARDLVTAYEPVIRAIHQAVDLSSTLYDFQAFLDDMIHLSKPSSKDQTVSVEDYIHLLQRHQASSHRFIHQLAKNGKDITEEYRQYLHGIAARFRAEKAHAEGSRDLGAGSLTQSLNELVAALSPADRAVVIRELDFYAAYLAALSSESTARTEAVMAASATTELGPGVFLARWQALLDATLITPAEAAGEVRSGGSAEVQNAARVDTDGERKDSNKTSEDAGPGREVRKAPSVDNTIRLLGSDYKEVLRNKSA